MKIRLAEGFLIPRFWSVKFTLAKNPSLNQPIESTRRKTFEFECMILNILYTFLKYLNFI